MAEAVTKLVRYVYLDVVGFTRDRSVEAQTDIVDTLNQIVLTSVGELAIKKEHVVFLPTGDGMGIAILDEALPYDVHLKLGLIALRALHEHNERTKDSMRQFSVRVGLNQNVDNIIIDINGARNVAGAGINIAQRVMNMADGSQVLVGQMVFDTLVHRERYMKSFRRFDATIKHEVQLAVYQFIESGHLGLSTEVPSRFKKSEQRFTLMQAYYLAHDLKNREFLIQSVRCGQNEYAMTVLLYFLALDSVERTTARDHEKPWLRIYGEGSLSLQEALSYYSSLDLGVCMELADFIKRPLAGIREYMEDNIFYLFVNDLGRKKLKAEYPNIWREFGLEAIA